MKPNYYNEIDKYAAEWLVELIAAGHIAPGVVDTRSIEDVHPADLKDFAQCHFFAGIGVWSLALRRAGWPDDRPVWTGSCPCQPFSAAGQGAGFADERHLWPAFYHLIRECRPAGVLGEQVASKDADPWIDLVHTDMEALGYAFGAVPFPSAGVGAPHIRDRLYWCGSVANANYTRLEGRWISAQRSAQRTTGARGMVGELANADDCGRIGGRASEASDGRNAARFELERLRDAGGRLPGPTNGSWGNSDWISCTDGKWRPVEPGTFPLAHGATSRVGRLRAYGNAINSVAAQVFIEAVMECQP